MDDHIERLEPCEVPLTLGNGGRVVGTAAVGADGRVTAEVTDPEVAAKLTSGMTLHVSLGAGAAAVDAVRGAE